MSTRVTGWMMLACAAVAAVAVAIPPTGGYWYTRDQQSVYDWSTWLQVGMLAVASVVCIAVKPARIGAAIVGISSGGQLAGTGIVAHRRWFTSGGFGAHAANERMLRAAALGLTAVGVAVVSVCLFVIWSQRDRLPRTGPGLVAVTAVLAAGVAVFVPAVMGYEAGNRRTEMGAHALMYSLPWAFVVLLTAWLDRRAALVAGGAITVSALPLLAGTVMIPSARPEAAFVVALVAAAALLVLPNRPGSPIALIDQATSMRDEPSS
ncbi:MAG: hypothetical protein JWN99_2202 [Ilumatobacteraceae bacterium]|nr:hypothetical protein [Ilumatobacteraceae bacterium]